MTKNSIIPGNLFLAPMAGYTDSAFCKVALQNGADVAFTEMISIEALYRNNIKSYNMAKAASNATFHAIQLFGSDATKLVEVFPKIYPLKPKWVDINCGCPVPKVTKTGAGSALMCDLNNFARICEALVKSKQMAEAELGQIICSVKIRLGWDEAHKNYLEAAKIACESGIDFISLHARTKAAGYSGSASLDDITRLADFLKSNYKQVKVCGSGDLFSAADGINMLYTTGVDAIMYARGAVGNPFIFNQTKKLLTKFADQLKKPFNAELKELLSEELKQILPTPRELKETMLTHLREAVALHGEVVGVKEMRKHLFAYTKGLKNAREIRGQLIALTTKEQIEALLLT